MKMAGFGANVSLVWALVVGTGAGAQDVPGPNPVSGEIADTTVEEAVIEAEVFVGSRRQVRSAIGSPVPIGLYDSEALSTQGYVDMNWILSNIVPSFNVNTQPISDAATFVRPASMRGLSSDSTLILINGKRRHRGSIISFSSGGSSDGAQGPDLAAIPYIALKQVQVLRDGASAQYGSDAVAGIINFVLKDDDRGGLAETRWGTHYEGDGASYTVAANAGSAIRRAGENNGFANFSIEFTESQATVRSVQRADAQALIDADQPHISPRIRTPYTQVWGAPDVEYDYKFFGNIGIDLTEDDQLYLFSNFSKRKIEGGFFFRNPTNRSGVNRGISGKTIKVADLRTEPDPATVPVVELIEVKGVLVPDPEALKRVADNPDFFTFNEKFPGGFTPKFGGIITDMSLAGGARGDWDNGWNYDASAVIGHHRSEFYMRNTINPQLIAHPDFRGQPVNIPTDYRPGTYAETDYTLNFDLSRELEVSAFHSPLNLAAGLEYRVEEFEIKAGEEYAWWVDRREGGVAQQGFGVGSNGFPAFPPSIAGATDRGSYATYLDLETDVRRDVLLGAAVRYEDYEGGVGDTINGKLVAKWQATEALALRYSISTGFRAPTLGQASVRNVKTTFAPHPGGGVGLADVATLPVDALPPNVFVGLKSLEPETSVNFSVGTIIQGNKWEVALDYFRITMDDRITTTSFNPWPTVDLSGDPIPNPFNYTSVRWYSNDFDTLTQGIDIEASYSINYEAGRTVLNLSLNLTDTSVERVDRYDVPDPDRPGETKSISYLDTQRIDLLENNLPDLRVILSATHRLGPWTVLLPRLRYFGEFVEYSADAFRSEIGAKVLVDGEAQYLFDSGLSLAFGAQNLFDTYPDENPQEAQDRVGMLYPESSPYGFHGGFYYVKAAYRF